ncbi:MAG: hypothetical protein HKN07_16050 [Acidimicrobiia bacterium]|nr:hypothetical protein [Acidimicrobiia bacterium]
MSDEIRAGKEVIRSAMPRPQGDYHCPLCDAKYERAGVCPSDQIPLRKRGKTL